MTAAPSLSQRLRSSGAWMAGGTVVGQLLRFGSNLLLTRLLMPEHFGVMALATVLLVTVGLLADIGIRPAVISSPRGREPAFLATVYSLQALRGALIFAVCALLAGGIHLAAGAGLFPADSVYRAPELPGLILGLAFGVLLSGFVSLKQITASRDLQIGRSTAIDLLVQLLSLASTLAVAAATRSVWAMLVAPIVGNLASIALTRWGLPGPVDRLGWEPRAAREVLGHARWILGSTLFTMVMMNADRLYLASVTDARVLGQYAIALALFGVIDGVIQQVNSKLVFPAFSEVQRQRAHDLPRVARRTQRWVDGALGLAAGLLAALAIPLVELLYDSRYQAAGPMLGVLAFSLVFTRFGVMQAAFMAAGRFQNLTAVNALSCVLMLVLLPVGHALGGVGGVVAVVAGYRLPAQLLVWWLAARMGLRWSLHELLILPALALGWGLGGVLLGLLSALRA